MRGRRKEKNYKKGTKGRGFVVGRLHTIEVTFRARVRGQRHSDGKSEKCKFGIGSPIAASVLSSCFANVRQLCRILYICPSDSDEN